MSDRPSLSRTGPPAPLDAVEVVECSAMARDGEDVPNPLFVPECTCPACTAHARESELRTEDRSWLRVSGRRQRLRVAAHPLGPTGRALLG